MNILNKIGRALISKSFDTSNFVIPSTGWGGFDGDISNEKLLSYYMKVPEVYALISLKSKMFSNMKLGLRDKISKKDVENDLSLLLKNPNFHQGQQEFLQQTKTYLEIFGNEYLYLFQGTGQDLPSQINSINASKLAYPLSVGEKLPLFLQNEREVFNYSYTDGATSKRLSSSDIIHINYPNVANGSVTEKGTSPMSANISVIQNIIGAYEARGVFIHNRGALGILSNATPNDALGAVALDEKEKENLQSALTKYGTLKNQKQNIITSLALSWQKIGADIKDLMLFEEIEANFQSLCSAYSVRREMFPTIKGATFENQRQAEKATYLNSIIPEANSWASALNNKLTHDKSYEIYTSYAHLPIFAEELREQGVAKKLNMEALNLALANEGISPDDYKIEVSRLFNID